MLRWLKRAFTQNLLLKFTALVCAVVLWVYVDFFVEVQRTLKVRLDPEYAGVLYAAMPSRGSGPDAVEVRVTVRGPSRAARLLDNRSIYLAKTLATGDMAGTRRIRLAPSDFVVASSGGVEVVEVEPSEFLVMGLAETQAGQHQQEE